jgi:hypothetical protein
MKMAIQKFMLDMLKDKYPNHRQVLDRICHYLVTEQDAKEFGALVAEIYQLGFVKATKDYTKKLADQGFKLEIVDSKTMDDGPMDNK